MQRQTLYKTLISKIRVGSKREISMKFWKEGYTVLVRLSAFEVFSAFWNFQTYQIY